MMAIQPHSTNRMIQIYWYHNCNFDWEIIFLVVKQGISAEMKIKFSLKQLSSYQFHYAI